MSNVVPLRKCVCGAPGTIREAYVCGSPEDIATFVACDACTERSLKFLARVRPVFEAMIAVGVPGQIANDTMSFLLDQIPDDSMMVPTDADGSHSS